MRVGSPWYTCIVGTAAFLFFKIFYRLRIQGSGNIPASGGVLLVANHTSFLDPPLMQAVSPRPVVYLARDTLVHSRLYRLATYGAPLVHIRRGESDLGAVRATTQLLREGHVVVMFPEQTRSASGRMARLRPGFHILARRTRAPIVPLLIQGAYEAWPRHRRWPRLGPRIHARVGLPLQLADLDRHEATRLLERSWQDLGAQFEEPEPVPTT